MQDCRRGCESLKHFIDESRYCLSIAISDCVPSVENVFLGNNL